MTLQDAITYWISSAKDARQTARVLRTKRRYQHALFFCHLALEKALKALVVVKTAKPPLPIHNLERLAEHAGLELTDRQRGDFEEIDSFNIAARYDDHKQSFHKKARGRYFTRWFRSAEKYCEWVLKQC